MQSDDIAILPAKYKGINTDAFCIYYESRSDLEKYFEFESTQLKFEEPFLFDAMMALACEKILFDSSNYKKINSFQRAKHTLEEFTDNKGRLWVDDSKGTNVDATIAAIDKYKSKKIELILGGDDKGANLEPLFQAFQKYDIRLYLIGCNIRNTETLAKKYNIDYIICNILENGVEKVAQNYLNEISVGILSPAAASLDQFSSYKERGDKFQYLVKKL
jgi:UDP-N-acetylmuramoylalanine--D-glutamate ligase